MDSELFGLRSEELLDHARENAHDPRVIQRVIAEFDRRKGRKGSLGGLAASCREAAAKLLASSQAAVRIEAPPKLTVPSMKQFVPVEPANIPPLYPWQSEALSKWRAANRRGVVEAVTGAGKTVLALAAIHEQLISRERSTVIVPTLVLLEQWVNRLSDAFPRAKIGRLGGGVKDDPNACDILVASLQSGAKRYIAANSPNPLIVADEVHRVGAEVFSRALEDQFTRRLGLSATWERADGAHDDILRPYFGDVVFTLDYARARKENAICPFRVALVGVQLTDAERTAYEAAGSEMSRRRRQLEDRFGAPKDARLGEFMAWVNRARRGQPPGAAILASMYLGALQDRRAALAEASAKISAVAEMAELARAANRTIVFTMTTEAADQIAKTWRSVGIYAESFHSGVPKELRQRRIDAFRNGKLKVIVVAKMFDEGVDVPDADLCIIAATSSSPVQLIQRIGRVLRQKADKTRAKIVLLFSIETNEDPNTGAHEQALDDIRRASELLAVVDYNSNSDISDIEWVFYSQINDESINDYEYKIEANTKAYNEYNPSSIAQREIQIEGLGSQNNECKVSSAEAYSNLHRQIELIDQEMTLHKNDMRKIGALIRRRMKLIAAKSRLRPE